MDSAAVGGDDLASRYSAVASDGKKAAAAREAAMLLSLAEEALLNEEAEALTAAKQAVDAFKALNEKSGLADALRLVVNAHRQKDDRKSAYSAAKEGLVLVGEHKYGKACMLTSIAECTYNKFGSKKRDEAMKHASEAAAIFKEVGDKKMEAAALIAVSNVYICRGTKMADKKEYEKAQQVAEEALDAAITSGERMIQAKVLHTLALAETYLEDFPAGLKHAQESVDMWRLVGSKHNEAYEHHCMAMWHLADKNNESAIEEADIALALFEEVNYGKGMVSAAFGHKVQAYLNKGDEQMALRVANDALSKAQNAGDVASEAAALEMIYAAQSLDEDRDEALETVGRALEIVREKETRTSDVKLWEASLLNQLAWDHMRSRNWEEAASALKTAFELERQAPDPMVKSQLMSAQCHVHIGQKNVEAALHIANEARDIFADKGNCAGEAYACLDIAQAQSAKGDGRRALGSCKTAIEIFAEADFAKGTAQAQQMAAELYLGLGDHRSAAKSSERSIEAHKLTKNFDGQAKSMILRSQATMAEVLEAGEPVMAEAPSPEWRSVIRIGQEAAAFCRSAKLPSRLAEALYELASCYVHLQEVEDALECIDEAMSLCEQTKFATLQGRLELLTAKIYIKMDKVEQARHYLDTAINTFKAAGDDAMRQRAEELRDQITPKSSPDTDLSSEMMELLAKQMALPTMEDIEDEEAALAASNAAGAAESKVLEYQGPNLQEVSEVITATALNLIGIDSVDEDTPLMDAGLDSLAAVEFGGALAKEFRGVQIPSTLMFDFPNVKAIGGHVYAEMRASQGF